MTQIYDDYDQNFCRDLIPVSKVLERLYNSGNRYQYMLAVRLADAQIARWLVKPEGDFISAEHRKLFVDSYRANTKRLVGFFPGQSGFQNGAVYTPSGIVAGNFQPVSFWVGGDAGYDKTRAAFESWHLSGKGIRSAWNSQDIVGKVAAGDRKYKATGDLKLTQALYPGYLPPDSSAPVLGVDGPLPL